MKTNEFSIIIPTWNNLEFVKCCVESIRKNSAHAHEVILHINDGSDGTLAWAKSHSIKFTQTPGNAGICVAVNNAAGLSTKNYIVYLNDDMYVCPGWDAEILNKIHSLNTDNFMVSGTLIEPKDTGNPCVVVKDYGRSPEVFAEQKLLKELKSLEIQNWNGSKWPPTVVSKELWVRAGGYSIELTPGMSSDDDFARKMWELGCREFVGVGASLVYHFMSKSTHRIVKNDGRRQFLMKWGINQSTFNKYFLRLGTAYNGRLAEPNDSVLKKEKFRAKLKQKLM